MSILVALVALSFLIFIHELGHFIAAKSVGIKVLEFSMFMGPKLFSFKKGETTYSLRLIPMGGYIKMEGEDEASDDARSFSKQSVGKRAIVIGAGPVMNIITAFIFAAIFLSSSGYYNNKVTEFAPDSPLMAAGMEPGDKIISYDGKRIFDPASDLGIFMYGESGTEKELVYFDENQNKKVVKHIAPAKTKTVYRLGFTAKSLDGKGTNEIEMITPDTPLEKAGAKRGDKIIRLDDKEVFETKDISDYLNSVERINKEEPIKVTIDRKGEIVTINSIVPFAYSEYTLGVNFEHRKGGFLEIAKASFNYCASTARNIYITLGWLFKGVISFKELSGPVGIIGTVGVVVQTQQTLGKIIMNLLYICSFISINLGIMNLLPFPALDGSMLLILLIEKIRGKALPQEKVGMISMIGFVLLICVLIATLFNDIPRWLM